jgi:hypothetical protein
MGGVLTSAAGVASNEEYCMGVLHCMLDIGGATTPLPFFRSCGQLCGRDVRVELSGHDADPNGWEGAGELCVEGVLLPVLLCLAFRWRFAGQVGRRSLVSPRVPGAEEGVPAVPHAI